MDELISRIAKNAGIDEDLAKKAITIILNFLNKSAPEDKMTELLDGMPEARELITDDGKGGMFGGGMMGAMGAMNDLTSAGLSMGQVQGVTKDLVDYSREKSGDVVDEIIASIPGLSQIV
ncbi:MAG: DUF2267 domain-containing protein [Fimbriimonadaceae bacterium]|nr:DUF2267 domain-containing protein [Alphaproteobacteria bacterium]